MAPRNVARPITMDSDTRQQIEAFARSCSLPHALVVRAKVILMACDGMKSIDIAEKVGLSRVSVGKWRTRFIQDGLSGLYDELRPGRPRQIEEEQIAELINTTLRSTPWGETHWSCRTMSDSIGLSKSTVQRVWNAFGGPASPPEAVQAVQRSILRRKGARYRGTVSSPSPACNGVVR